MSRYVAFLGGLNVGKHHRVPMARLRSEFEDLGYEDVWTFIVSGNVVFEAAARPPAIEKAVAARLEAALGFAVPTMVRTAAAVTKLAAGEPFGEVPEGETYMVAFLAARPAAAATAAVEALSNDHDTFLVRGAELHWHIRGGLMSSTVKPAVLDKALRVPATTRNITSLRKLAAKL